MSKISDLLTDYGLRAASDVAGGATIERLHPRHDALQREYATTASPGESQADALMLPAVEATACYLFAGHEGAEAWERYAAAQGVTRCESLKLYLAVRSEAAAIDAIEERQWGKAISAVSTASAAYQLAKQDCDEDWVAGAVERGLQRCMAIGIQTLGEG
ncbi:hypothetical protein NLG97_g4119 [Lecanicillium saksenae]|uniref:Uncharacterized protein n=1 Tax=Lecanicillium saksenae TaxID=468837 RepID=A0ACC1QZH0_9HYPO|nr:hypothetical protein NLG97_g4119 [Lecanicillium saksenae]